MTKVKYTKELLEEAVANNHSIAGVMRDLNLKPAGGNFTHVSKKIVGFGISTDHFTRQAHNKGKVSLQRKSSTDLLVLRDEFDPITKGAKLKRSLIELGVPYVCQECGITAEWNGKSLVLQVDHINGKRWDNRKENLRFLCPNCHSQSDTFSGRNK